MKRFLITSAMTLSLIACGSAISDPVDLPSGLTLQERCQVLQDHFDRADFTGDTDEMQAVNDQMDREGCFS